MGAYSNTVVLLLGTLPYLLWLPFRYPHTHLSKIRNLSVSFGIEYPQSLFEGPRGRIVIDNELMTQRPGNVFEGITCISNASAEIKTLTKSAS